jgi:CheY-like chemotaxis protein
MDKYPNILIAEDDKDDYMPFEEALIQISSTSNIVRAKNGLTCITYLKTQDKPDLIFLDLNIPLKNGLDCLLFIKDTDSLKDIPVVIYSTSHYIKDIDACYKNEAHYYIVKPVIGDMLVDVLLQLFGRLDENPGSS